VTFIDLMLARLATRSGNGRQAVPKFEAAMTELREFGMDAYADFAQALLAEAEGLGGAPERALAVAHEQLKVTDRNAPLNGDIRNVQPAYVPLVVTGRE
jgi:multidrug efflux pump subunit AcrA (membrane-fusion protein)